MGFNDYAIIYIILLKLKNQFISAVAVSKLNKVKAFWLLPLLLLLLLLIFSDDITDL